MIPPLDYTYFKILTALPTIMIDNFQFWQKQEPIPLSSTGSYFYQNTETNFFADRKNLSILQI